MCRYCTDEVLIIDIVVKYCTFDMFFAGHMSCGGFAKNVPSERVCKIYVK